MVGKRRLFIGASGFEQRSLGWVTYQNSGRTPILERAFVFTYEKPKGQNLTKELNAALLSLGVKRPTPIRHSVWGPHDTENIIEEALLPAIQDAEEIVIDISAMTKLLILITLCKLETYKGTVRIVYSEAEDYAPTKDDYEKSKEKMEFITKFPSRGFEAIIRTKCLSSIRMQGQPISLIAFTSFNEQLVRHMLGSLAPHRLLFINGRPPREDFAWREAATQDIHKQLIEEYSADNQTDENGILVRHSSTLDYRETIQRICEAYEQYGLHERIICAANGSKMQTVGLFFSKMRHKDIHIEYPTPDSYYVKGLSNGVRAVHQVVIPKFADLLRSYTSLESG